MIILGVNDFFFYCVLNQANYRCKLIYNDVWTSSTTKYNECSFFICVSI